MNAFNHPISTAADVILMLQAAPVTDTRRRDLISSVNRVCDLLGCQPSALKLVLPELRAHLAAVRPAAHRMSAKTCSNLRSSFAAALEFAGAADRLGRGEALRDPL